MTNAEKKLKMLQDCTSYHNFIWTNALIEGKITFQSLGKAILAYQRRKK